MRIVIPSLDYADYLAVTLPAWRAAFPDPAVSIVVVTTPDDKETQKVARDGGAGCVATEVWQAWGHRLDKAAALDEAFGFRGDHMPPPKDGERCLAVDADVYPFGTLPGERVPKGTIYGCARYACPTMADLTAHVEGKTPRESLGLIAQRQRGVSGPAELYEATDADVEQAARACLGYFQMWAHSRRTFGSWQTAGGYDIAFRNSFPRRVGLLGFYVLHLGPMSRQNWRGRVLPQWATA